ncbi:MAG: DUF4278 domain-containing protein [Synechococcales cyanobacterium RM1_1_8]|nr:DUF4278 domain-containing protein [Synechococcales cyanobacterium RM1_1_8]
MTLNYRGSQYELPALPARSYRPARRGVYRGVAMDFSAPAPQPSAARPMTYRGVAYTVA